MPVDQQAIRTLLDEQARVRRAVEYRPQPLVDIVVLAAATALIWVSARHGQADAGLSLALLLGLLRSLQVQRAYRRKVDLLCRLLLNEQLERRFVEDVRRQAPPA